MRCTWQRGDVLVIDDVPVADLSRSWFLERARATIDGIEWHFGADGSDRVARRGKHQLVHLADGRILHVHFRMNGDWVFDRAGDPLPRFARAFFQFTNGRRVVLEDSRALSTIDVHPAEAKLSLDLGPEPSDPTLTPSTFLEALQRRRIPIKVALLNQRIIAGLGNIYASEALWRAKLHKR